MQRPHQFYASFAELLLKGLISKSKDRGNRKQIYILMDQERSYDCDGLKNQYTKMIEWKFLKFKVWSVYLPFILFASHVAGLRQIEMIFHKI